MTEEIEKAEKPKTERKKRVRIIEHHFRDGADKYYRDDTPELSSKKANAFIKSGLAEEI